MGESEQLYRTAREEGFEPWMVALSGELGRLAINPDRPISGAFAAATIASFRSSWVMKIMRDFYEVNPDRTAPEAQRMLLTAAGALLPERPAYRFPDDYTSTRTWLTGMQWIHDTFPYAQRYYDSLLHRDLSTPISQRYVIVHFLNKVLASIIGPEPLVADVGSSDGSGDRRLLLHHTDPLFAFDPVHVIHKSRSGRVVGSDYKSDLFNQLVSQPDTSRRIVGIDKIDPTDPATEAWIRACPTPEEIKSGSWASLHDVLMRTPILPAERLGFRQADVSRLRDVEAVLKQEGGRFRVASSVLSWYQGTPQQRKRKFKNTTGHLIEPDGLVYYVDFARRVDGGGAYLAPLRQWLELNVFVWHKGELTRVAAFTDGRAHTLRLFEGLGKLARGGPHEAEVNQLIPKKS